MLSIGSLFSLVCDIIQKVGVIFTGSSTGSLETVGKPSFITERRRGIVDDNFECIELSWLSAYAWVLSNRLFEAGQDSGGTRV